MRVSSSITVPRSSRQWPFACSSVKPAGNRGVTDAATVLPVQIYIWADSPERAFVERTSAAIMVLLAVLLLMNGLAILLRRQFERRW